jgi:hypothetical protein
MTTRERFAALDANKRKLVLFMLAVLLVVVFLMMPSMSSLTGSLPGLGSFSGASKTQPRKPSAFAPPVAAPEPAKKPRAHCLLQGCRWATLWAKGLLLHAASARQN